VQQRCLEIEKMLLVGFGQDAQGARDQQMPMLGLGAPLPFVDQQAVSMEREGEYDGSTFAGIKGLQGRVRGRVWTDFTPLRRLGNPRSDSRWRVGLLQFLSDGLGDEPTTVEWS
jgi:hypothetical protein